MGEGAGEVTCSAATRTHGPQWEGQASPSHPRTATVCLSLLVPAQFILFEIGLLWFFVLWGSKCGS